jgi:spore maturation protein CgeB
VKEHGCSAIFSINEWGMDFGGVLWEFLDNNGFLHVNWSVDDPFYEEIIHKKKYRPSKHRFDFVSDKGYLEPMMQRGYNVSFLPLAVDPALFNPGDGGMRRGGWEHDVVFVGNSYLHQMDSLLKMAPGFIDVLVTFLSEVVQRYCNDVTYPVEAAIDEKIRQIPLPTDLTHDKALFIAKHAAGYFGRKRMIKELVKKFSGFKVYGEPGWLQEIPAQRLGTAKYYDSLCDVYRKSKITIDINRMVIRNGFTQRVFDAPASGSFLLTGTKPVVNDYFKTDGPEQELAVFRSQDELVSLIGYYLSHESQRLAIAERGMNKVLSAHTYDHRVAEMFRVISRKLGT